MVLGKLAWGKKFTYNFTQLIAGKSLLNIADSFYMIAITIGLVKVYAIDASSLSTFTLLSVLPAMFGFLYGHVIDQILDKKIWLIVFQCLHIALVTIIIAILWLKLPVIFLFITNFAFYLVNSCMGALETSFVPQALDHDDELIESSVDVQYVTGNIINIASNFVASVLLGFTTYLVVLNVSLPFFVAGVFFFCRMRITANSAQVSQTQGDTPSTTNSAVASTYIHRIGNSVKYFASQRVPSAIITCEAFLSGALDLLLALAPLYLVSLNIDVAWLGTILAVQQGADLLGATIAPFITIPSTRFFCWDYITSGTALLLVFIVPWNWLKLVLFGFAFVIIGVSGNYFSKMVFASYDHDRLGSVDTIIRTLYAIFGVAFLLIPYVYSDIVVLGVIFNAITIGFGVVLAIGIYSKKLRGSEIS